MRSLLSGLGLCLIPCALFAQPNPTPPPAPGSYQGIPAGFDFPAESATLEQFRRDGNVEAMRKHAWNLWAGVNQPAVGGGPVWETWFESPDTFSPTPQLEAAGPKVRKFRRPRQQQLGGVQPEAAGDSNFSFVLFNKETNDHIRSNRLYSREKLNEIKDAFPPGTEFAKRKIPDFPRPAVSLKVVWRPIRQTGFTFLPVWDDRAPSEHAVPVPPRDWGHFVAVDPVRAAIPAGETTPITIPGSPNATAKVVSLNDFYHFKIQTSAQLQAALSAGGDFPVSLGDSMALVCMHVTTKEIDDWVWATFWWHDLPNDGQFGRFRTDNIPAPFQNYVMDVAFDMTTPREIDQSPNVVMNPWLEASGFKNGALSNCMTCHQRALWPPPVSPGLPPWLPITRGPLPDDDPLRADRMNLDFLWSVILESTETVP